LSVSLGINSVPLEAEVAGGVLDGAVVEIAYTQAQEQLRNLDFENVNFGRRLRFLLFLAVWNENLISRKQDVGVADGFDRRRWKG
jgi:hypothetical protein